MNIHNRQSKKQVFFSLEFVNILLQMEAKAVKNASSLLYFSGHSELETGLFKGGRSKSVLSARGPRSLVCACPVAGYINHLQLARGSLRVIPSIELSHYLVWFSLLIFIKEEITYLQITDISTNKEKSLPIHLLLRCVL